MRTLYDDRSLLPEIRHLTDLTFGRKENLNEKRERNRLCGRFKLVQIFKIPLPSSDTTFLTQNKYQNYFLKENNISFHYCEICTYINVALC